MTTESTTVTTENTAGRDIVTLDARVVRATVERGVPGRPGGPGPADAMR